MSALAFDTLKASRTLQAAGFDEGQAEAVVNTLGEALGGNVATKADLTEVRAALEADIAAVRTELATVRADLADQFAALYKQLWLMAVGIVGLTVTLGKLIP